jgi:hypothetical protein
MTGFFHLGAASTCGQPGDPKEYFSLNHRAGNDAIAPVQTANPVFNPGISPHQVADGVCVKEIDQLCGNPPNVSLSRTG